MSNYLSHQTHHVLTFRQEF